MPDTIDIHAFDLGNPDDRKILSDWMEEHNRFREAAILRDPDSLPVAEYGGEVTDYGAIQDLIDAELHRLGWLGTDDNPDGCYTTFMGNKPRGWISIVDEEGTISGDASNVFEALKKIESSQYSILENGFYDFPSPHGYPHSVEWWPLNRAKGVKVVHPATEYDPNSVIVLRIDTNDGWKFTCGWFGDDYDLIDEATEYTGWYSTPEEAESVWKKNNPIIRG